MSFIYVRCPRCRNVRTECKEGCSGRQKCRPCKIKFSYEIRDGGILYGPIEAMGKAIKVRASSPPTLTG